MEKYCCSLCGFPLLEDIKIVLQYEGRFSIEAHPCNRCHLLHDKEDGCAISIQGDLLFLATDGRILADSFLSDEEVGDTDTDKKFLM